MAEDAVDIIESLGLGLKVAYIEGDDLMPKLEEIKDSGEKFKNLDTGIDIAKQGLPIVSANAYLGCWGIKKALDQGADRVICPRVTDAALVMGPAAWKYDWNHDDYDHLQVHLLQVVVNVVHKQQVETILFLKRFQPSEILATQLLKFMKMEASI